jgi:hypothetical protein
MEENNIELYNNRPIYYNGARAAYLTFGCLSLPFTFMLLFSSIKLFRQHNHPHYKICLGILICDFISSISYLLISVSAFIDGTYLPTHAWYCNLIDLLYIGGAYLSLWFVGLMSFERGLLIIHRISPSNTVWVIIMIVEVCYFLVVNFISIGYNQMGLAHIGVYCMSTPQFYTGYITLISYFAMMLGSVLVTIYSYVGIAIIQRRRAWKDIRELNLDKKATLIRANRVIIKVLMLLFLFLLANGLEIVLVGMEIITGVTRSILSDYISVWLLSLNPIINSLILIQFHENVKASLFDTFPIFYRIVGSLSMGDYIRGISNTASNQSNQSN